MTGGDDAGVQPEEMTVTNLANRTTLVTGAASGMGLGIAVQVARRGGRVVLWDLDEDRLDEARETVDAAGPQTPLAYRCNVADVGDVNATAARVAADLGSVDVLVNNAGVVSGDWLLDLSDDQIRRTFDVNTLSLFWVTRAFLPDMVERNEGHVVTMASASGLTGVAKLTDYASSKWAAIGFNDSLRQEMRRRAPGVRTTVLCPFYVNTGLFRGVKTRFPRLLPILEEDAVVERIIRAIERNRSRLLTPWLVKTIPAMRALPAPVQDAIADSLGANTSMDEFVGRRAD
ncbi:MAG: SDR family oxidoreductase [Acidimicrobiia bacterium]|nr:SDR family oxidoreductase [Acidimicrobiia bacterium]